MTATSDSETPDYAAQFLESQKRAQEERDKTRRVLLADLRALGATRAEVDYEGYGDSGNVEDVRVTPESIKLEEELNGRLESFGWDFAYGLNPGFENNDGGYGAFEWDIETDKIHVTHNCRYMTSDTSYHEDL